ncbi:AAT-domain-containing protein [Venturia nashicola]|uniref:AAT-domain-containing protein n=1 Tax=Venturia nashicola TaxID=86259 RepID=A0A4Z1PGG3_9PEZI|nr:AAT-domain-containing protein [Venturia nashicola]
MLEIRCEGTPYEIGHTHGLSATPQIQGTLKFYTRTFYENTKLSWPEVETVAMSFMPVLQKYPELLEEMQGVADGAGVSLASIIALNVRTEVTYGLMKDDGCTTLAYKTSSGKSFLSQNWDWQIEQKAHLIVLHITPPTGPKIAMVTEAGIIGKIGLNSTGVAVTLNAIKSRGMSSSKLPVHLGLRLALMQESREKAAKKLEEIGIAAACTITIADPTGAEALECSYLSIETLPMDSKGRIFHSNHYLLPPAQGVVDKQEPKDTLLRVKRIEELTNALSASLGEGENVTVERIADLFKDEENLPTAICRMPGGDSIGATLFNIVSDLTKKRALLTLGRPSEPDEKFWMGFD